MSCLSKKNTPAMWTGYVEKFSGNRTRTYDPTDMSRLLYRLSYAAMSSQA